MDIITIMRKTLSARDGLLEVEPAQNNRDLIMFSLL